MSKVHLEYNDLVIYSASGRPKIGRYVRKDAFGKIIIVPLMGNIARRKECDVIKFAKVYKENKQAVDRQVWSVK